MSVSASACPRNQIPADTEVFRAFGSLKTRSLFHFGNHENLKFGSSTAAGGGNGARDWHPRKWRTSVGRRMAIDLECHPRVPSIVGTSSSGMAADAVSVTRTRNSMMSGDHQTQANPARNTANIGPLSGATNCILIGKHRHINHGQCYQRKHRAAVPHDRRARTHKRFGEPVATPVPPNIFAPGQPRCPVSLEHDQDTSISSSFRHSCARSRSGASEPGIVAQPDSMTASRR